MGDFSWGFFFLVCGLFIGANIGCLTAAMCKASGDKTAVAKDIEGD